MVETILMVGTVWFLHAVTAGLPVIGALIERLRIRWAYCLALLVVPFWALVPAQMNWLTGGMVRYLTRQMILTGVVFVAEGIEVLPTMRKAPAWSHLAILAVAVLSVIPIQLVVPAYPD